MMRVLRRFDAPAGPPKVRLGFGQSYLEAIRAGTARVAVLPQEFYGEIPDDARRLAWTVSNLTSLEQVQAVLDSLTAAMRDGKSLKDWKKEALANNWVLSAPRLETIYRTHVQTAYSAGTWEEFMRNQKWRPYLMYSAIDDARVRPTHLAMSGYIAPIESSVWDTHSPPMGFNCRCTLISLTKDQAERRGYGKLKLPDVQADSGGFGHRPTLSQDAMDAYLAEKLAVAPAAMQAAITSNLVQASPPNLTFEVRQALAGRYDDYRAPLADKLDTLGIAESSAVSISAYLDTFHAQFNAALHGDSAAFGQYRAPIAATQRGLLTIEPTTATVYRSLGPDDFASSAAWTKFRTAHLTVGAVVEYRGFTSAAEAATATSAGGVTFVITSQSGRALDFLGADGDVLFPFGARFRVVKVVKGAKNAPTTVYLEEVPAGTPVTAGYNFAMADDPPPVPSGLRDRLRSEVAFDPALLGYFQAAHGGHTPAEAVEEYDPILREIADARRAGK